jgi:hypothetical protein
MHSYTSPPIPVDPSIAGARAELVFAGVEQAGPSFEGRVFLNNPDADDATALAAECGYAGSFHVYGYGSPPPPAMSEAMAAREPGGEAVAPIEKRLRVDGSAMIEALRRSAELRVTVVAVPADPGGAVPERAFDRVELVFTSA